MPPSSERKPGLLLVHPRLHDPTPSNAATFLRWTKLHFRDMLNLPDAGLGRVTRDLRFTAPDNDTSYSHDGEGKPRYLYTCLMEDIGMLKSTGYDGVSRMLNLESTRKLGDGEEAVGYEDKNGKGEEDGEKMVFDIIDAKFAVFEEVGNSGSGEGFQDLPARLTSTKGVKPTAPKSCLVVLNIEAPDADITQKLQEDLRKLFERAPPCLKSYSSVYKWSGVDAQPQGHPLIDVEESGEWMVMFLVVDEEGKTLSRVHLVQMVGGWVEEEKSKRNEREGVEIGFGVWDGEVFMS
jgi:hypothetical protein